MKVTQKKKTILVVDDEKEICKIIQKILIQEGYAISIALNGKDALRHIKEKPVDLMLIDLKMPTMNGLEVIKEAHEICADLKAILLTAYGTAASARSALYLGVHDFLTKPFDNKLLKKVVREALRA